MQNLTCVWLVSREEEPRRALSCKSSSKHEPREKLSVTGIKFNFLMRSTLLACFSSWDWLSWKASARRFASLNKIIWNIILAMMLANCKGLQPPDQWKECGWATVRSIVNVVMYHENEIRPLVTSANLAVLNENDDDYTLHAQNA